MREGDTMNVVASATRPPHQEESTRFTAVNNASNGNGASMGIAHHLTVAAPLASTTPLKQAPQHQIPSTLPLEDWNDNSAEQPPLKKLRTPDTSRLLQHQSQYPQQLNLSNPQTPQQQAVHLQRSTSIHESGTGAQDAHSEENLPERGNVGDEPKMTEVHELRTGEGSPQIIGPDRERKIRKRQFANRTKTGCITCRRRKKKCDEGKPECINCKRGGFVCEGYNTRVSWPKAQHKPAQPVTIQSKLDVPPTGSPSSSPRVDASALPSTGHNLLSLDPSTARALSPQQRPMSLEREKSASTPPPHVRPVSQLPTSAVIPQQNQEFCVPRPPATVTTRPLIASPRAVSPWPSGMFDNGEQLTEKQKMLSGQEYYGSSPELVAERERCRIACHRLNNALLLAISKAEQWRLFVETLRPGGQFEGMPGGIIDEVDVETPFYCSYGTNISLGREVRIGPGCTIVDACSVTIKARTILDGDVKIYTTTRPQDPRKREGAKGPESAKPVVIEEDCWIGGNVTILPGVTIEKGAVVGPGSVVRNPASVLRGLYPNGVEM
ncbi:trimeric LpxA-like protein [Kalaharituber pfeilii]|nr:trimeric LpxA-like protein [Kalaharituber pfeilii]